MYASVALLASSRPEPESEPPDPPVVITGTPVGSRTSVLHCQLPKQPSLHDPSSVNRHVAASSAHAILSAGASQVHVPSSATTPAPLHVAASEYSQSGPAKDVLHRHAPATVQMPSAHELPDVVPRPLQTSSSPSRHAAFCSAGESVGAGVGGGGRWRGWWRFASRCSRQDACIIQHVELFAFAVRHDFIVAAFKAGKVANHFIPVRVSVAAAAPEIALFVTGSAGSGNECFSWICSIKQLLTRGNVLDAFSVHPGAVVPFTFTED